MARSIALSAACAAACFGLYTLFRSSSARLLRILGSNFNILDEEERQMARRLILSGQQRILQGWPQPGVRDAEKRRLIRRAAHELDAVSSRVSRERLKTIQPPICTQKPHKVTSEHGSRDDVFYWLRDDSRKDPDVLDYLKSENTYCQEALSDTEPLQEQLFKEMKNRIQEADRSAPVRRGPYYYYEETFEGKQYCAHKRRRARPDEGRLTEASEMDLSVKEELIFDENAEAAKHKYYSLGALAISPDHRSAAFAEDTNGSEKYIIRVKVVQDTATGRLLLAKGIEGTSGNVVWAADNQHLFYVIQDEMHRPYQVWRHALGTDPKSDVKVFEEDDEAFFVHVEESRDKKLLYIKCGSSVTNETRFVASATPLADFKVVLPRQSDVEYDVAHWHGTFIMVKRTKDKFNSEIVAASVNDPSSLRVVLEHSKDYKIEDLAVSDRFMAVFGRTGGLQQCTVHPLPESKDANSIQTSDVPPLAYDEPAYEMGMHRQGAKVVKKVKPVRGGFSPEDYTTERIWATADDGTKIPISLVFNRHVTVRDSRGSDPLHLNVYGAYEICNDAAFSANRLSLLDRGIIYAIAHVRGGGEMGRTWYENGKFLNKRNTFTDTIDCARYLIAEGWTSSKHLTLEGRSAGGMTVGAVVNMRPDLFNGVVMGVPFVDCLTTMLDRSIPLTVIEFEEWGNPAEKDYYEYMRTYSPVDNISRKAYPNILVTAGLNDPRVAYWEPAKFVAKLRLSKSDDRLLAFKCNMDAGHFSQSGRFDRLKEVALDYAFIIKCAGKLGAEPFKS